VNRHGGREERLDVERLNLEGRTEAELREMLDTWALHTHEVLAIHKQLAAIATGRE
jgi:hypothetical protein